MTDEEKAKLAADKKAADDIASKKVEREKEKKQWLDRLDNQEQTTKALQEKLDKAPDHSPTLAELRKDLMEAKAELAEMRKPKPLDPTPLEKSADVPQDKEKPEPDKKPAERARKRSEWL